jgi:hydrogenase nickel incorporation protein HypA/HybF
MHEMSYVVRLVNEAITAAEENNANAVKQISVLVGEMTDVVPDYLKRYYPDCVKNTILEGSELVTEMDPVVIECGGCGKKYHPSKENNYGCPDCGSAAGKIIAGKYVVLKSVEIED